VLIFENSRHLAIFGAMCRSGCWTTAYCSCTVVPAPVFCSSYSSSLTQCLDTIHSMRRCVSNKVVKREGCALSIILL